MPDLVRVFIYYLSVLFSAGFLFAIVLAFDRERARRGLAQSVPPESKLLKNVKSLGSFTGLCLGVSLFWKGFGIGMCASQSDPSWIMEYTYLCLWTVIPLSIASFFAPRMGGLLFLANAGLSCFLMIHHWNDKISAVSAEDLYTPVKDQYSLGATVLTASGPILLLGAAFVWVGFKLNRRNISQ